MVYCFVQDGWGRWQLGFHALFTLAANCPNLRELTISEEHLEVRHLQLTNVSHKPYGSHRCEPDAEVAAVSMLNCALATTTNVTSIQELAEQHLYPHHN